MAEQPAGEKTEKPTPKRIRKAREDGKTAQSMELPSALTLVALMMSAAFAGPKICRWFAQTIRQGLACNTDHITDGTAFIEFFSELTLQAITITLPLLASMVVAAIIASILIGGVTFTMKPLKFKTEELSPANGFKRIFSMNSLVKLILSILKIVIIGAVSWFYIKNRIEDIAAFRWLSLPELASAISKLMFGVLLRICIALLIMAAAEAIYQKWKYTKNMMMTKQEVKEERKSQEGSPEIKSKIRSLQIQMASRKMLSDVPDANVVVVNPTHYAVAIKYDNKTMPAPIVVAKGADNMCEKIKEIARANGVPIIRRAPLARTLYSTVEIGHMVPESLFVAVAEVLAMLHRIRHNR